jgi:hypothetical protein
MLVGKNYALTTPRQFSNAAPEAQGVPLIFTLIAGGRDTPEPLWTTDEVEARMIAAMKLDRLSPRLRGPKAPGNSYIDLPDDEQSPDPTAKPTDVSRAPLLRAERDFADSVLEWFRHLADESAQTRRVFAAWLRGKATGHGALKVWQAQNGVLNGSVAHARKRCVAAIVAALNSTGAAKVAIPNAGRFARPVRRAA